MKNTFVWNYSLLSVIYSIREFQPESWHYLNLFDFMWANKAKAASWWQFV